MRSMTFGPAMLALCLFTAPAGAAAQSSVTSPAPLRDGYPASLTGLICKDAATGTIIYVETDGRHVVAISPEGKILWRKDPFIDGGLEPYRMAHPTINAVRASSGKIGISFTSSQFGEMDIATGAFTFMGQN